MSPNDPWGNRDNNGERGGRRGNEQGPPDLEEIWRDFNQRLSGIFGQRRGKRPSGSNGSGGGGGGSHPGLPSFKQVGGGLGALVLLVLVVWLASGFYTVDTNQRGVVLRMGKYSTVTGPGLNWRLPWPVETHEIVDMTGLRTVSVGNRGNARALMLTDDLNIVAVQFAVQYVLKAERDESGHEVGPRDYIFKNLILPGDGFVLQIAETAMREIVGKSKMDYVLYGGREQIAADAQELIQDILNRYESGIQVSRVTMEDVQPPEQVQAAFDDATKATQDGERQKNEGEAYANKIVPAAQGEASRLRADAEAYRASVTARAEGETARFKQVFSEFKRAPQVTRERMYLDAVQQVLSNSSKVMIDNKGGNNLLYLPLDKLVQQPGGRAAAGAAAAAESVQSVLPPPSTSSSQGDPRGRDFLRDRARGER
ncbi:MAG: FtsH protease activity modulator HflK [Azoarcus sp.]|jgi:membrane protease subunit HflK|nr:FtsH protease activity modulator HflK [Azoarcus sp.]